MRRIILILGLVLVTVAVFLLLRQQRHAASDDYARLMNLGKTYYERGETAKAINAFTQSATLQPGAAEVHLNLANTHLLAGDLPAAETEARQVLAIDRNSGSANYVLGCALLRQNKFEQAIPFLQVAYDLDPSLAPVVYQLGLAHLGMGNFEDANILFTEVLRMQPDHPAAHYSLSQSLIRSGKQVEAARELELHRQSSAKNAGQPRNPAFFERTRYTQIKVPQRLEQPDANGIKITFVDATQTAFGSGAASLHGPVGVIDPRHEGRNSLFLGDKSGFRFFYNSNGVFLPRPELIPTPAGARVRDCLVGDLDNDRVEDILLLGEGVFQSLKGSTNFTFTDVAGRTSLRQLNSAGGALADLDFTGKLDLLTLSSNGVQAFRNQGNFLFRNITATSGVPANAGPLKSLLLEDWNRDDLTDLLLPRQGEETLLYLKQRGGPFVPTNVPNAWPRSGTTAVGDLNNDLFPDLVSATAGALEIVYGSSARTRKLSCGDFKPTVLALVDYDNDGWLDIVAAGPGVRIWRNLGEHGFKEMTQELGLGALPNLAAEWISAADLDEDGDTDLLLSSAQGVLLLRNEGGNANKQLKLHLVGNRSNTSGLGVRIEVTAEGLHLQRTVSRLPVEIGVGKHQQVTAVTVHWFDLALDTVDVVVQPKPIDLIELQLSSGSCPYLFAWDGKAFRFVTDLLGAAPLGLPLAEGLLIAADPHEYVRLGDETQFVPRQGSYQVQITEELREVLYLDESKLVVVDRPPGSMVHTTGKLLPKPPFPAPELLALRPALSLRKALRAESGEEVTPRLRAVDHLYLSPLALREPQLRGLAEPFGVVLDFGPLPVNRPLVLCLNGWLHFGGGMANVGASHHPELPFPFPQLEVEVEGGTWQPVAVTVGAPAGKTKTILVDLEGKLPPGSRRLRLSTAFEIHWDKVELLEKAGEITPQVTVLAADQSDLHWRGYSRLADLPWDQPLTPIYEQVMSKPPWTITPSGWCTRYGGVKELIASSDNALVLLSGGDELTLSFQADRLPPKPEGWVREFFLYNVGWDKDADFHVVKGQTVEPLPFHGMNDQLYGAEPRPELTNEGWRAKFNTRWVSPWTYAR